MLVLAQVNLGPWNQDAVSGWTQPIIYKTECCPARLRQTFIICQLK